MWYLPVAIWTTRCPNGRWKTCSSVANLKLYILNRKRICLALNSPSLAKGLKRARRHVLVVLMGICKNAFIVEAIVKQTSYQNE